MDGKLFDKVQHWNFVNYSSCKPKKNLNLNDDTSSNIKIEDSQKDEKYQSEIEGSLMMNADIVKIHMFNDQEGTYIFIIERQANNFLMKLFVIRTILNED